MGKVFSGEGGKQFFTNLSFIYIYTYAILVHTDISMFEEERNHEICV